jgi:YVTN family beta-propeller protein
MILSRCAIAQVLILLVVAPSVSLSAPLGTIENTFNFHAFHLIADPNRPYVYATTASSLEIINTNTLTVEKSLSLSGGGRGLSLAPDDSTLYVAGGSSNSVYAIDLNLKSVQHSIDVGDVAQSVAAGNNNRLFVETSNSVWFDSVVKQVDATTGASTGPNVLNGGNVYGGNLQISPDRSKLYYATYGLSPGDLYKLDVSGPTATLLWKNSQDIGENGEQVVLSPDGSMVAYVCGYGYQGYKIPNFSTADMSLKTLFPTGAYPDALAYSPDSKLAYALHTIYPTAIDVYNTNSSSPIGQFTAKDRGSDMMVDRTGQHLFVSYDGVYNNFSNLVVYATAYNVPEPSGLFISSTLLTGLTLLRRRSSRP